MVRKRRRAREKVKNHEKTDRDRVCPGDHSPLVKFPPISSHPALGQTLAALPIRPREPDGTAAMPPAAHATSPQLADARRSSMNASTTSLASLSEEWGPLDHVVRELTVSLPCGAAANAWGPRSDAPARASSGPTQQPRVQLRRVVAAAVQLHRRRHRR